MRDEQEEWRSIPEWPYEASSLGRIRRTVAAGKYEQGRVIKPFRVPKGYLAMRVYNGGGRRTRKMALLHRLVAAAFLGPAPEGYQVNHRDGDKANNRIDNLEYVTASENMRHARKMGLLPFAKLKPEEASEVRRLYGLGHQVIPRREIARRFGIGLTQVWRIGHS